MAILQPDGNAGEITLNVSAEGMKGASITIRTVDRMSAKQEGKDIVTPGSIWKRKCSFIIWKRTSEKNTMWLRNIPIS